jgi:hypothetical protein
MNLMEMDRQDDAAKALATGFPVCIECGWGCDDAELDLCCDCADTEFMTQMLRGDHGRTEQREARESIRR